VARDRQEDWRGQSPRRRPARLRLRHERRRSPLRFRISILAGAGREVAGSGPAGGQLPLVRAPRADAAHPQSPQCRGRSVRWLALRHVDHRTLLPFAAGGVAMRRRGSVPRSGPHVFEGVRQARVRREGGQVLGKPEAGRYAGPRAASRGRVCPVRAARTRRSLAALRRRLRDAHRHGPVLCLGAPRDPGRGAAEDRPAMGGLHSPGAAAAVVPEGVVVSPLRRGLGPARRVRGPLRRGDFLLPLPARGDRPG